MKKAFIVLTVVVLLIAMMVAGAACAKEKEELPTGELPTLEVGNEWVYKWVVEGVEYTVTIEVTGGDIVDGKDCHVTEWSFNPPLYGIVDSGTLKIDKATYFVLSGQSRGTMEGLPFSVVATSSYEFPEASYWPLEVGKEVKVIETSTTTTTAMGETETETAAETSTYKVEKIEEVTVSAGTFKCFKTVEYDETGKKLYTSWHSDKVKNDVKWIDHETGDIAELVSYSLR